MSDRVTTNLVSAANCYCCTCDKFGFAQPHGRWDPACHNHGAHGGRGCEKHGVKPENCDCGCGYEVTA